MKTQVHEIVRPLHGIVLWVQMFVLARKEIVLKLQTFTPGQKMFTSTEKIFVAGCEVFVSDHEDIRNEVQAFVNTPFDE